MMAEMETRSRKKDVISASVIGVQLKDAASAAAASVKRRPRVMQMTLTNLCVS